MYFVLYKTICLENGKIYIGAHSCKDLEDGYLGSGSLIKTAIKKYGKEKFKREILEFYKSEVEMYEREKQFITEEFVKLSDNYNLSPGGMLGFSSKNTIPVFDENGKCFRISKDDPRWISGELKHNRKGYITVQDDSGLRLEIKRNDPKFTSGEFKSIVKGKTLIYHKELKCFKMIDKMEFNEEIHVRAGCFISPEAAKARAEKAKIKRKQREKTPGELFALEQFKYSNRGKMNVRDENGNISKVNVDDPRVNVTLFHIRKNQKMSEDFMLKKEKFEYVLKSPTGEIVTTRRMKEFARSKGFTGLFKVGCKRFGWELLEKLPIYPCVGK